MSGTSSESAGVRPPLEGVRILAFEQFGAGPWATMHLADMGAEVVKIEDPRSGGDVARYVPPYTSDRDSLYFQSFNRNKKSVTLDLRRPGARDVLHRLVRASDAVFNNLRETCPPGWVSTTTPWGRSNPPSSAAHCRRSTGAARGRASPATTTSCRRAPGG